MSGDWPRARMGVVASIVSSSLFGVVFILSGFLQFSGDVLFGWRIFFTTAFLIVLLIVTRRLGGVKVLIRRIAERPIIGFALVLTAAMLGLQQWLFTWAPGQGRGLPVALGYFIMPIMLALVGRIVFKERLGRWRVAAVIVAAVAVVYQIWLVGGVSWETLVVALGYPVYFSVRRLVGIGGSAGLTAEMVLMLPVALLLIVLDDPTLVTLRDHASALNLAVFGVIASAALLLYIGASGLLPMSVFGLLSYLEPILLAIAATLVLGEPLASRELPTYIAIAAALVLLALETVIRPRRPPHNQPLVG